MPVPASEEEKLEWKSRIEQQRQSGLSVDKWCLQNQVRPSAFQYWKEQLFPRELKKSSFVELKAKRSDTLSLQARGVCIRLGPECDLNLRKQLLALFAEGSC